MWTSKRLLLLLCCMGWIGGFFYRYIMVDTLDKYRPPPFKVFKQPNISISFTTVFPMKSSLSELLVLIDWPEPPSTVSHVNFSTSPQNCDYHLLNPRDIYKVGESLEVLITARDHYGKPKNYGGDFFQAKLHSKKVKAGVTGQVKDHGNGSYAATFLLPWAGEAEVHIRLIHSSEAVDVLKKKRESHPRKVYFIGYFRYNGSSAVTECNVQITGNDVCTYIDPVSSDRWHCERPQNMPCHSLIFHSVGGYRKVTNALEDSLLSGSVTAKTISGSVPPIIIKPDERFSDLLSKLPTCKSGLNASQPSGFYNGDHWTSLVCQGRHFPHPSGALDCLKGKSIHMFGDSTLRQWFEYLERFIPSPHAARQPVYQPCTPACLPAVPACLSTSCARHPVYQLCPPACHPVLPAHWRACQLWLSVPWESPAIAQGLKRIDLHVNYQSGPLIAVETNAGLVVRWQAHGLPLRTTKTMMSDLHYESADLAGIGGGPHTVIMLTLCAHFTTFPVRVYLERLEKVRRAISSLFFRSPETTVIIKSANTGYKSIYGSDWLTLQLDILLRAAFKGMGVIILDVWDMTSCHYLPDNIHPGPPVIKNEVDLMLSYICPH
ncbi:NXPE family member 3-like isoform X2 [Phyllobates terribilis]|uniref:NXPE family member 3-like isoform X2 n=1 Tax=Phyllobates terribilis TaxID=111132 RepID=UPI003CCA9F48